MATAHRVRSDGGRAFPGQGSRRELYHSGLTVRQWYKGMALAAAGELSAQANQAGLHPKKTADLLAKAAGDIADAMIAEDERAIQEDVDA